jgi:hypothetical protein
MNKTSLFHNALLVALLSLGLSANTYAQKLPDDPDNGKLPPVLVTTPPLPPLVIENFGRTANSIEATLSTNSQYSTQIVNGRFDQPYPSGWSSNLGVNTYRVWGDRGNPAGSGKLLTNYQCDGKSGPSGTLMQTVHVLANKQLSFNWRPGSAGNSITGVITDQLAITLVDANTNAVLVQPYVLDSTPIPGTNGMRSALIDMSRFLGLDVRIEFVGYGAKQIFTGVGLTYTCSEELWIDNVQLIDGPAAPAGLTPIPGNWYNRYRSGSGWDFRRAPAGTYYAIWYTYDYAGQPTWYITGQGTINSNQFQANLMKCTRTQLANGVVQASCPDVGRVKLNLRTAGSGEMQFDFYDIPNQADGWDAIQYFELTGTFFSNYSGHFHSNFPTTDPAWGINSLSYQTSGGMALFSSIYYHENGQPRWVVGNQQITGNDLTVTMQRLTGACPTCAASISGPGTAVGSMRVIYPGPFATTINASINIPNWFRPLQTHYMLAN